MQPPPPHSLQHERQALNAALHLELLTRILAQALGMGNPLAGSSNAAASATTGGGQQHGGGGERARQQQRQQQQKQAGGGWEAAVAAAVAGQRGSPFLRLQVSAVAPAGWRGGGAGGKGHSWAPAVCTRGDTAKNQRGGTQIVSLGAVGWECVSGVCVSSMAYSIVCVGGVECVAAQRSVTRPPTVLAHTGITQSTRI